MNIMGIFVRWLEQEVGMKIKKLKMLKKWNGQRE